MANPADKRASQNFLRKAQEMLDVAGYALKESKFDACVVDSVHSAINAIDALALSYLGERHRGPHEDAIGLVKSAFTPAEFYELAKQYNGLMKLKNDAEYQPYLMDERQATDALKRASRIVTKVKHKLG